MNVKSANRKIMPYMAFPKKRHWYNLWKKSYDYYPIQQSNNVSNHTKDAFVDYLLYGGHYDLAAYTAAKYYCTCYPLADAIDRIAREIAAIPPQVFDTKEEKFVDHPVLALLSKPNADSTYSEYITKLTAYLLLNGENFNVLTGNITKPPLEIFAISPQYINITADPGDGFAGIIQLTSNYRYESYKRTEIEGRFRFYNKPGTQEIYQTKNFNPMPSNDLHGKSPLQAIYYEIEQYINSSVHNLSLLKRGATVTGFLRTEQDLSCMTDDQRERLREQWNNCFTGSANAGKTGIFDKGIQYETIGQTNQDMNFRELKQDVQENIYNRLGIPAPLVSSETMTMNNLSTAKINFYDNTIIPLVNRLFEELTLALMYRYPDSENLKIAFDPGDILALEPRRNEQIKMLKDSGVIRINELRELEGFDPIEEGDVLLVPSTEIPLNSGGAEEEKENGKNVKQRFTDLMQNQVDGNGVRKYSDDEIDQIANRHEL